MDYQHINTRQLPQAVKSTIQSYLLTLKENGVAVDKAILFGSYVSGTQQKNSDIDLCIISSSFGKDYRNEMKRLLSFTFQYDLPIDVIPFTPQDLQVKYDSLAKQIRETGIVVD